jgi:putative transposase
MLTPYQVHYGLFRQVLDTRATTLVNAYLEHPERFVKGVPSVKMPSAEVWINKPSVTAQTAGIVT